MPNLWIKDAVLWLDYFWCRAWIGYHFQARKSFPVLVELLSQSSAFDLLHWELERIDAFWLELLTQSGQVPAELLRRVFRSFSWFSIGQVGTENIFIWVRLIYSWTISQKSVDKMTFDKDKIVLDLFSTAVHAELFTSKACSVQNVSTRCRLEFQFWRKFSEYDSITIL